MRTFRDVMFERNVMKGCLRPSAKAVEGFLGLLVSMGWDEE